MLFQDRKDAGIRLADALEKYAGEDAVVFALPRGGVELGAEIAKRLNVPLDLVLTKKIGHPANPEYAICAVAEEGDPICNPVEVRRVDPDWLQKEVDSVRAELMRRREHYLGGAKRHPVAGKIAIIVDDGIATGLTMMAAIEEMKKRQAKKIVVAIPVTPSDTAEKLLEKADDLVALDIDRYYRGAVGAYYRDFRQVSDKEVINLLKSSIS